MIPIRHFHEWPHGRDVYINETHVSHIIPAEDGQSSWVWLNNREPIRVIGEADLIVGKFAYKSPLEK